MKFLTHYLAIGTGFYVGTALGNLSSFVNASLAGLFRGLLVGFVAWPIGVILQLIFAVKDEE